MAARKLVSSFSPKAWSIQASQTRISLQTSGPFKLPFRSLLTHSQHATHLFRDMWTNQMVPPFTHQSPNILCSALHVPLQTPTTRPSSPTCPPSSWLQLLNKTGECTSWSKKASALPLNRPSRNRSSSTVAGIRLSFFQRCTTYNYLVGLHYIPPRTSSLRSFTFYIMVHIMRGLQCFDRGTHSSRRIGRKILPLHLIIWKEISQSKTLL